MGRNSASLLLAGIAHVVLTLALGVSIGYLVGRGSIVSIEGTTNGSYERLRDPYEAPNASKNALASSLQRTARETQPRSPLDKVGVSLLRGKVDVTPAPASAPSSAWGSDGHRAATERPTIEVARATPSPSNAATPAPTLASPPQPTYWPTYEPTASASPRPTTSSPSAAPTRGPSTRPAVACTCAPTLKDGADSPTAQTSSPTVVVCEPLFEETCCNQPSSMTEGDRDRVCLELGCSLSECPSSDPSRTPTPSPTSAGPATSSPSIKQTSSPTVETPQPSANPSTGSVTTIPTKPTLGGDDTLRPTSPFPTMNPAVNFEAATTSPTEAKKTCKPSHEAACCKQPVSAPEEDKERVCHELGCSLAECPETPTDAPTPSPSSASLTTSEPSSKPTSSPSDNPTSSSPTPSPSAEPTTLRPSFSPSSEPPFFTTLPTTVPTPSPRDTLRPTTSVPTANPTNPTAIDELSSQPTSEATPGSTPTVSKETTAPPTLPARRDDASTQQDTDVTQLGSNYNRPVYTSNVVETACSAPERVGGDACVLRCTETTKLYEGSTLMGVWSSSFESECPKDTGNGPSVHTIEHTIRNRPLKRSSAGAGAGHRMNGHPYRVFHSLDSEPGKVIEDASKHLFKGSASEAEYAGPDQLVYASERSFAIGDDLGISLDNADEAQNDDYYRDY